MASLFPEYLTTTTGADFSECLKYRYRLWRVWGDGPQCNFLMLNPSKANDISNDPTVERCQRRATRWGFGGVVVTNLFAFKATDPNEMLAADDPIGPDNDEVIREVAEQCQMVVCAWGNDGGHRNRHAAVLKMLRQACPEKIHMFKLTQQGHPWHPLYLPYSLAPVAWSAE